MFSVLIVEDELIERKYIVNLLQNYNKSKIQIVGETNNGVEAIEKALYLKPDIIFMDIQMPLMDGIEASAEIKKVLPEVKIIILTAFNTFEYAQQAIKIGVLDFLVKPYSDENFYNTLSNVTQLINNYRKQAKHINKLKSDIKKSNDVLEKEIIFNLVNNEKKLTRNIEQYMSQNNIDSDSYECIVLKINDSIILKNDQIVANIKGIIKDKYTVGHTHLNNIILIVFNKKKSLNLKAFRFEATKYLSQKYNSAKILIVKGKTVKNITQIRENYLETLSLINEQVNDKYISDDFNIYIKNIKKDILNAILQKHQKNCQIYIENFFNMISKKEEHNLHHIKSHVNYLYIMLIRGLSDEFLNNIKIQQVKELDMDLKKITTIEELQQYFINLVIEIVEIIDTYRQTRNEKIVYLAKDYLDENYNRNISLTDIAGEYNISYHHLSKIFKQVFGINYKDYLLEIRMDKAKCLINQGTKKITDIAQEVGYVDPNYFSKVFKRYVGLSPTDYSNI